MGDDAVVAVVQVARGLVLALHCDGLRVVGEKLKRLVEFGYCRIVVLAQTLLASLFHRFVEQGYFFGIKLFLFLGFGQALFGQFVVGEDAFGGLKLEDGRVEVLFRKQCLTLAHGGVEGILLVFAFLQDGSHRFGLSANIFVVGKHLESQLILRQGFLIALLGEKLVARVKVGIEHFLTCAVLLDFLYRFVELLSGSGVVFLLFQGHLVVGLRADVVFGVVFLVAFFHQRLIRLGVLGLKCIDAHNKCSAEKNGKKYAFVHFLVSVFVS